MRSRRLVSLQAIQKKIRRRPLALNAVTVLLTRMTKMVWRKWEMMNLLPWSKILTLLSEVTKIISRWCYTQWETREGWIFRKLTNQTTAPWSDLKRSCLMKNRKEPLSPQTDVSSKLPNPKISRHPKLPDLRMWWITLHAAESPKSQFYLVLSVRPWVQSLNSFSSASMTIPLRNSSYSLKKKAKRSMCCNYANRDISPGCLCVPSKTIPNASVLSIDTP